MADLKIQNRMLRLNEVIAKTGLSRSTIYAMAKQGKFPKPITLGARAVAWVEADIDDWLNKKIMACRAAS